ncbi:hypothetical protein KOI35_24085 [Actinoplanes bogorensis]|uniref:Uncharacterized protein n=1 Tax=Paractinoplanes bogorensis TaxID=1610840 RepID=A0ABS5YT07_9ACTN|nr:hypothetical protein [Actinoplanes bogorensis]MBU2666592.1 hypothetical protein [Actinoplanes bogorensis]
MDRDVFAGRLHASAEAAWAFARKFVAEELPAPLLFRVRLNQSYDGNPPEPGEVRFPQDSTRFLSKCDAATAVAELWRDGRVPEWIDVAVVDETGSATVIELVCCGRFTDDNSRLYHAREGRPPFHVVGPALPPHHDGTPFSIHLRAECWDHADARHLAAAADEVWSLALRAELLAELPALPNLEILTIRGLPSRPWGFGALGGLAPNLSRLDLSAEGALFLDGDIGFPVREMTLTAAGIGARATLPTDLDRLALHLRRGTDHEVIALLDGVRRLGSLSLRGTPVTDAVLAALERFDLNRLDLVDTQVSGVALSRFRADHPETELYPRTLAP